MAIDPICGMTVDERTAISAERAGETFYFCCEHCKQKFLAAETSGSGGLVTLGAEEQAADCCHGAGSGKADRPPPSAAYYCPMCPGVESDSPGDCPKCGMALEKSEHAPAVGRTVYVCPMHPEVRQEEPGDCPKCGMALEPQRVAAEEEPDPELASMTLRFWVSLVLTLPVFLLAMLPMLGVPLDDYLPRAVNGWLQFACATPVVLWGGWPFFTRGVRSLITRNLNMFTLIALGTAAAYGYSVAALLAPSWFPEGVRHGGHVEIYFEAAAVIVTLVLLGQVLELRARRKTGAAIRELLSLAPPTARRLEEGGEKEVPLEAVKVGDLLRLLPGAKVPVDGVVHEGTSRVDESMLTGEPAPVAKSPGSALIAGTVNTTGSLVLRAEKVGSDTVLAQIVALVASAQRSRAPIQRVADQVAAWFVPAVLVVALGALVGWLWFGPPETRLAYAVVNSVAVLIIACPCALGLATPMSIMVGVGRGAREGVLIRNAETLELLEKIDTLVVDKTGTLTEGRPRVVAVKTAEGFSEEQLLRLAAAVERGSEHPLAAAVLAAAEERDLAPPPSEGFESIPGAGVSATVEGETVLVAKPEYLREREIAVSEEFERQIAELQTEGSTVVLAAVAGRFAGLLAVADPLKDSAREAVAALREMGIRLHMLTGDNERTARAVAEQLGIDEVEADVSPRDKHDRIAALRRAGRRVAMAGDGVNDAPALAAAEVGIAMGTGADVAIESAGVTLLRGDLRGILRALRLSRRTMTNIRQNLFFAFVYNALGVPIAAGALYPLLGLLLNPMFAAAAMSFSSVSVIGNALRLRTMRI